MAKYFVFIDETCTWSKEPVITEFKWTTNIHKNAIVQKIKQKLGIKTFKEDIITTVPNFFSIWNY